MDLTISATDLRATMTDTQDMIFQALMADIRTVAAGTNGNRYQLQTSAYGFHKQFVDTDRMEVMERLRKLKYGVNLVAIKSKFRAPYQLVITW